MEKPCGYPSLQEHYEKVGAPSLSDILLTYGEEILDADILFDSTRNTDFLRFKEHLLKEALFMAETVASDRQELSHDIYCLVINKLKSYALALDMIHSNKRLINEISTIGYGHDANRGCTFFEMADSIERSKGQPQNL